jgi:putative SOS response-associated peptidase YedK
VIAQLFFGYLYGWVIRFVDSPEGEKIFSYTIITTDPNELMIDIHDRMPMILSIEDERKWLDAEQPVEELKKMLQPFPVEK